MAPVQQADNVGGAHTTIVSIGVMIFVAILLIELAGVSHQMAIGIAFLLIAVIAIAGMTHQGKLQNIASYPALP